MPGRFHDKVAVVTGGGGAIGSAAARRFAAEGASIAILDIDPAATARVVAELTAGGARAIGLEADAADETAVEAAIAATVSAFGGIDVLFNNAGISGTVAPVHELGFEDWDRIVRVNLRGIFTVQRQTLRAMIEGDRPGAVVNMASSMSGWDVLSGGAGYIATKHAVLGLTKVAALDVARYGIRVNAVCPGVIETSLGVPASDRDAYLAGIGRFADRIPLRRIGQPENVAAVVAFLASPEAVHVTGAGWLIDGGQTLQSWANAPDGGSYPRTQAVEG